MRRTPFVTGLLLLTALTGCNGGGSAVTIKERLRNPLFAERYAEAMVDRLVELDIANDPIMEDAGKKAFVDEQRKHWLEVAREGRQRQRLGTQGNMIMIGEYTKGDILYLDNLLYFGTLFEIDPLPSISVFLTSVVDPRDVVFPDETAMDLGPLQSAYGAQTYDVPAVENPLLYRTVVLWDTELGRLHSFAQLGK
ncbi:MAG: hypothetical protein Greene041662_623 [Candidatus Peregrinibacteria bacterium Greene0416_62]|nr:MAG: hypothetical protein Greene041662_623 [Candidatus Peregrinibacteria bacterium Greene0416_62]TSD00660.1 MAG: hypothetical protein Greene101449_34 [Candidatus Peregrinibacteria bacterium Greene1014_49]